MSMPNASTAARSGWSAAEEALLICAVRAVRENAQPLKDAFLEVAEKTGRQPNSIRNYYYTHYKQLDDESGTPLHSPAFVPFTDEEIDRLLREMLLMQADGASVRACTMRLGEGSERAMLRYQNKYRALIRNDPDRVRAMVDRLRGEGLHPFDPYAEGLTHVRRAGRPRKKQANLLDLVGGVVNDLSKIEGLDVSSFFEALGALAVSAARGAQAQKALDELPKDAETVVRLNDDNRALRELLKSTDRELQAQRERFHSLMSLFRRLVQVNRDFLSLSSVVKVSSLSDYLAQLRSSLAACEEDLPQAR